MQIFIAGATGVIGRRVVPLLTQAGHRVTAVCRRPEKKAELELSGATTVSLDLFDPDALRDAVVGYDVVINLATHIPTTMMGMMLPGGWRENDRIRRVASSLLVDAALDGGVGRFIQESFAPIYEANGSQWIDEESPVRPVRYNRSVFDAERSAARFTASGGTGVVLRFAGFYGPDSAHTMSMIESVRKGWAPLPGALEAYVSSIHLDDAAAAVVSALGLTAGTFNVADDEPVSRREYAVALAAVLGAWSPKFPPEWMGRLAGSLGELMSRSQRISNRKIREESGWKPAYVNVRAGWRKVVSDMQWRAAKKVA